MAEINAFSLHDDWHSDGGRRVVGVKQDAADLWIAGIIEVAVGAVGEELRGKIQAEQAGDETLCSPWRLPGHEPEHGQQCEHCKWTAGQTDSWSEQSRSESE